MSKKALAVRKDFFDEFVLNLHATSPVLYESSTPISGVDNKLIHLSSDSHYGEQTSIKRFLDLETYLLDRPECETNEKYLQVLPYVTLRDTMQREMVYCYQRPVKGTESRLHGDYSIGYGGHIEESPTEDKSFAQVIIDCVQRELEEEVGLKVTYEQVLNSFRTAILFHDTSNPVGKVHLCLSLTLFVNKDAFGKVEESEVLKHELCHYSNLISRVKKGEINVESWTRILLNHFRADLETSLPADKLY